ncbi:hypothetical protein J3B00_004877 [Pseudomonas sp. BP8]|nr:hypothetical protein [Pseudomonas sp. BP8]
MTATISLHEAVKQFIQDGAAVTAAHGHKPGEA